MNDLSMTSEKADEETEGALAPDRVPVLLGLPFDGSDQLVVKVNLSDVRVDLYPDVVDRLAFSLGPHLDRGQTGN